MSSTDASNIWTEVPEPVGKALESFARGDMDLSALRDMVADVLKGDPGTAEPIHQLLDEELKARRLTIADYGELVDIVGAVVSEQIPTEASDKAPEESGVYRVIDEHTLIPTSITEWGEEVAAGQDDVQKESEADTHSLELEGEKPPANLQEALSPPQVEIGPGSVLRERFQLEEEVARGSMGIVYRAVDLVKLDAGALDPQVAVKVVSPEFANNKNALRTFQNEVANTQHLSHPHIVHLFELDRDGDRHFITMEWLEGQSLAELLDNTQGSALEHTQTYAIIEQLCDAMIYAHEQGVVHADIKPGNVFLLATGEVKLIDFGIAKTDVEWQGSADMEKFQAVALTPAYAGCERLEHKEPTAQDDLYSLACLIYRLLAGRRVFGSLNALEAEEQDAEVVAIGGMEGPVISS
jgi:predicted Ser/Thr protein kinase